MLTWLFTLGAAAGASAQSVEDYRYFMSGGILDPGVSDETVNVFVREGIVSEDPEIRELTARALGEYVMHVVHGLPTEDYGSTPERSFSVPDLKSFLIGHWREQHRRSGYDTDAALHAALGARVREEADGSVVVESFDLGLPDDASPEEVVEHVVAELPVWTAVPQILCALYPGDGDVLELVWEQENKDVSVPKHPTGTLHLLNLGRFTTPEANAFRIGALVEPEDTIDAMAVSLAAEGLALSRPVEAVPHLVSAASEHPGASEKVLVTLAGYGDDVLSDYASEIADMLDELPSYVRPRMGAVANAVSRLGALDRRQIEAEPPVGEVVVE